MQNYTKPFFESVLAQSLSSAREIVPIILELIQPKRIVDVGCGNGDWLSAFRELGVEDVYGIDGDWVDVNRLKIPIERFSPVDLKYPFDLKDQFDLVISLEVAEHIPRESAEAFVDSLCRLGSIILFSAAIPHQGGTNHLNEQWPDYWARIFQMKGYVAIDCIRKRVWSNEKVDWWYAQNMILFVSEDCLKNNSKLMREHELSQHNQLSLVHPKLYLDKVRRTNPATVLHVMLAGAKDTMKDNVSYFLRSIGVQKR